MTGFPTREKIEQIKATYPAGTRILLHSMEDPYAPVPPETEGVVQGVDDAGSILMCWSNGQSLSLIVSEDSFTVLSTPEPEQEIGGMKFE